MTSTLFITQSLPDVPTPRQTPFLCNACFSEPKWSSHAFSRR
jgi:hypothetical protein